MSKQGPDDTSPAESRPLGLKGYLTWGGVGGCDLESAEQRPKDNHVWTGSSQELLKRKEEEDGI